MGFRNKLLINYIFLLGSIVGIWSPLPEGTWSAVAGAATALFTPIYFSVLDRPFLIVLSTGLLWNLIVTHRFKHNPISVLALDVRLKFTDPAGSTVNVERVHVLRANHPGVCAYYLKLIPAHGATIPGNKIGCSLVNPNGVEHSFYSDGCAPQGWEIIQQFKPQLPYAWYMPLLPEFLLLTSDRRPTRILKRFLIVGKVVSVYHNDFNRTDPSFEIMSSRYPHRNIKVQIDFQCDNKPASKKIWARRIQANAVHDEHVEIPLTPDDGTYSVSIDQLSANERLKISWQL